MRVPLRLAILWTRNKRRRVTSVLIGASTACLVMLYIILNAFALSGAQTADKVMANLTIRSVFPARLQGWPQPSSLVPYTILKTRVRTTWARRCNRQI